MSDSRLTQYWVGEKSIVAIKQVGDSVLIQTIRPPSPDAAPTGLSPLLQWPAPAGPRGQRDSVSTDANGAGLKEGVVTSAEFRAFWDSLGRLGFWRLDNAYRAVASKRNEAGGSISVSFENRDHSVSTKAVRFFAPESCPAKFRQVFALLQNMARFATSTPGWMDLLRYETKEPIEGLRDWYHAEALRAIAAARDSQGIDTLLSMLVRNDDYGPAIVSGLGHIGSERAVPALETFLALQEVNAHTRDTANKETLALAAAKVLVAIDGSQSVPAIRRYLDASYHSSQISDWCALLASVGDHSLIPEVLQILSDSSRYRRENVSRAAGILQKIGYSSQPVLSGLFQALETELNRNAPDDGSVRAVLSALRVLTDEDLPYRPEDSLRIRRSHLTQWLRWWTANAESFPTGPESAAKDGYGFVQIYSTPSGAAISLDSTSAGSATPFLLLGVAAGKHHLRLMKERYADWDSMITIARGRTTKVEAVLSGTSGDLQVSSKPSGAAISLDRTNTGATTPHLFTGVPTGTHTIELTANGYPDWNTTVVVAKGQTTNATAKFERPPDSLWIYYVDPDTRCAQDSAGTERAVKFGVGSRFLHPFGRPFYVTKVSAVFDTWTAEQRSESSFRFKIYDGDGRTVLYESPVLEAVPGGRYSPVVHKLSSPVLVRSEEFYLSVAPIGTNGLPASLGARGWGGWTVFPGSPDRRSYAGSPGHWSHLVQQEFSFAVLVRHLGSIQVNSTPSGAAIWLDAVNTGKKTPALLSDVPMRSHDLFLTQDGHADWRTNVSVAQGQTTAVNATLSRSFGALLVNSTPSGASIFVDDFATGRTTPYLFTNVAAGRHRLEVRAAYNLAPRNDQPWWESRVRVSEGQTATVEATLATPPDSLRVTYASDDHVRWGVSWGVRTGPERAVRFNPRDFGFDCPVRIRSVRTSFHLWDSDTWRDSSFRFRIYGSDGQKLLYQSPVLRAFADNANGSAVVHELGSPISVDSGDFYVAVSPVDSRKLPPSVAVWGYVDRSVHPIPYFPANPNGRSYTGSPGHWSLIDGGELLISVQLRR